MGAVSAEGWSVGNQADLEVLMPSKSTPLELHAVVRHQTGVRCGLEFVEISPEQRKALHDACKL
jgi:hypothetical protein